ncbi:MAG: 3-dehydroquinate dehydratase-1 [Desulforhopalus sp.]|jgi:3-dehydroquinate dehydratase-1
MRQQSNITIDVRGVIIGGKDPRICLPLVAAEFEDLIDEAKELVGKSPDILEWRVDAFKMLSDVEMCLDALEHLRKEIGDIPLIFTCRSEREGGMQKISQQNREALILAAMASGTVDIVDVELDNDDIFLDAITAGAKDADVTLILSHHNFTETPTESFICEVLNRAQERGADIAKIAVMPNCYADVLTLLSATNTSRIGNIRVPMITISMGDEGGISRLAGGLFGSDVTFASGRESSAPGQYSIDALRTGMALLYK